MIHNTKLMGVMNINDDSFYSKSRFNQYNALAQIEKMTQEGAHSIDIGSVSSRPGSKAIDEKEELQRIRPIIDLISQHKLYETVCFSIDSYTPLVVNYALDHGFTIVNDITGLRNDTIAKLTAQYQATVVIMHMQNNPLTMQNNPQYDNIVLEIENFFDQQIQKAHSFGINKIILDVGIGFGKTLEHNLTLINHLWAYKKFNCELLIGASRKSLISAISPSEEEDRLPGTLSLHLESIRQGASIIRCHDIKEHYQAISVQEALQTNGHLKKL